MKFLRIALEVIGALSLLVVLAASAWIFRSASADKVNKTKPQDVRFILNWGGIPTNQNIKVIASYESARSFTGDHVDYYCIQLSKFEVPGPEKAEWHNGPEENPILAEALELGINSTGQYGDCFPSVEDATSGALKIMFWSVILHGREPTAADIILYDPRNKRLYYVSYKT